ncbi:hypothetical protein [Burkholderia perseverans]|uniref:hypothetical protein n=1 Tax=Burkholderia perseverans TaxID=2615214 RepID=UPI001FEEE864|nr:hypothetical protein [Burkholderia perseverans]
MTRIRHLLARRLTNPLVASLLLLAVAFRLLLPPGLMLAPSTGTDGVGLAICSGHGALFDDVSTLSLAPAAQAAATDLANALAGSAPSTDDHSHAGDLCPFSAALAIGLATALPPLVHALRAIMRGQPSPADDSLPASGPAHGPLGARAPPVIPLA